MNFIVLASSATASFQNIECEPAVKAGYPTVAMEHVPQMEVMEEEVKQGDKVEQENLAPHIYLGH